MGDRSDLRSQGEEPQVPFGEEEDRSEGRDDQSEGTSSSVQYLNTLVAAPKELLPELQSGNRDLEKVMSCWLTLGLLPTPTLVDGVGVMPPVTFVSAQELVDDPTAAAEATVVALQSARDAILVIDDPSLPPPLEAAALNSLVSYLSLSPNNPIVILRGECTFMVNLIKRWPQLRSLFPFFFNFDLEPLVVDVPEES